MHHPVLPAANSDLAAIAVSPHVARGLADNMNPPSATRDLRKSALHLGAILSLARIARTGAH
jgi:hypothetical protein